MSWILRAVLVIGIMFVGTALELGRQTGTPALDSLWAEDGAQFLENALRRGTASSLVLPSVGYLHTLPRLLGALASVVPVRFAPMVLSGGAAMVVALLSGYVFITSRKLFRTTWPSVLLAGLMLLLPTAGWETMNNATNLQWYLLFPCFLALVAPPKTRFEAVAGILVVVATTLSTPAALAFLPVAVWNLWTGGLKGWAKWVPAAFVAGLAVQMSVVLFSQTWPTEPSSPGALPGLFGFRVAGALLVGQRFLADAWDAMRWTFAYGALALIVVVLVVGIRHATGRTRLRLWMSSVTSLVLFAGAVLIRGTSLLDPEADALAVAGSRWVTSPILLLAMSLFLAIDVFLARSSPRRVAMSWVAAAVLIGFSMLTSYRVQNLRSEAPRWKLSVRAAAAVCEAEDRVSVRIPISPSWWTTMLPCRSLE